MRPELHFFDAGRRLALAGALACLSGSAMAQGFQGDLLGAVTLALQNDPAVTISRQQLAAGEGELLSARAPFDTFWNAGVSRQRSYTPLPGNVPASAATDTATSQLSYSAGVSQRLDSGIVVNPAVTVNRIRDDGAYNSAPSTGSVALNLLVPLRKGSGTEVNLAPVNAAALARDAIRYSYRQAQAQSIVRTVNAYWDLVAARQTLDLTVQAEGRAGELLANARKLARADEIPRADVLKYEVRRVAHEADRTRAEQQLNLALQALAQAMNQPLQAVGQPRRLTPGVTASLPLDPFPSAEDARLDLLAVGQQSALARLLASATERRLDIRAAEQRLRSAETLADAARKDSGSQLDLGFSVGYTGLVEGRGALGSVRSLGQPARGANVGVSLNYVLPGGDFERQGLILKREAAAEQARLELEALRLRVDSEVSVQLDALRASISQLGKAREQLRLQTTIDDNEKRSYRAGLSTLLDLFTTESQLTAYQSEWVQAQRNFAQALVLFRFQTASLVPVSETADVPAGSLQARWLTTLPDGGASGSNDFFR